MIAEGKINVSILKKHHIEKNDLAEELGTILIVFSPSKGTVSAMPHCQSIRLAVRHAVQLHQQKRPHRTPLELS